MGSEKHIPPDTFSHQTAHVEYGQDQLPLKGCSASLTESSLCIQNNQTQYFNLTSDTRNDRLQSVIVHKKEIKKSKLHNRNIIQHI